MAFKSRIPASSVFTLICTLILLALLQPHHHHKHPSFCHAQTTPTTTSPPQQQQCNCSITTPPPGNFTFDISSGSLDSDDSYQPNECCTWTISCPDPTRQSLTFDGRVSSEEGHDFVHISNGDGSSTTLYTGSKSIELVIPPRNNLPPSSSLSPQARVSFTSDNSTEKTGFWVDWSCVEACNTGLYHWDPAQHNGIQGGTIISGLNPTTGKPEDALANLTCEWNLICDSQEDQVIKLSGTLNTGGFETRNDYLMINGTLWSSGTKPINVDTFITSGTASIKFHTGIYTDSSFVNLEWQCLNRTALPPREAPANKPGSWMGLSGNNSNDTLNSSLHSMINVSTLAADPTVEAGLGGCYNYMTNERGVFGITTSCVPKAAAPGGDDPFGQPNSLPPSVKSLALSDYGEMYIYWNVSGNFGHPVKDYSMVYLEELFGLNGGASQFYSRVSFSDDCSMIAASIWNRKNGQGQVVVYDLGEYFRLGASSRMRGAYVISMDTHRYFNQTRRYKDIDSQIQALTPPKDSEEQAKRDTLVDQLELLTKNECDGEPRNCDPAIMGSYKVPSQEGAKDGDGHVAGEQRVMSVFSAVFSHVGAAGFKLQISAMTYFSLEEEDFHFTARQFNLTRRLTGPPAKTSGFPDPKTLYNFLDGSWFYLMYVPALQPPTLTIFKHFFVFDNSAADHTGSSPSTTNSSKKNYHEVFVFCLQYFNFIELGFTQYQCYFIKYRGETIPVSTGVKKRWSLPTFWIWEFSATFPDVVQYHRGSDRFATTMGSIGGAVLDFSDSCVSLFSLSDPGILWDDEQLHLLDVAAEDIYCATGMIKRLQWFSPGRFLIQETTSCYGACLYPSDPQGLLACDDSDLFQCKTYFSNDGAGAGNIGVPPWPNYYGLMIDQLHVIGEKNFNQRGGGDDYTTTIATRSSSSSLDFNNSSLDDTSFFPAPMAPYLSYLPEYVSNEQRMQPVVISKIPLAKYACSGQWQIMLLLGGNRAILAIWSVDKLQYKHGYYQLWRTEFLVEAILNVTRSKITSSTIITAQDKESATSDNTSSTAAAAAAEAKFSVGVTTIASFEVFDFTTGKQRTVAKDLAALSYHLTIGPPTLNAKSGAYEAPIPSFQSGLPLWGFYQPPSLISFVPSKEVSSNMVKLFIPTELSALDYLTFSFPVSPSISPTVNADGLLEVHSLYPSVTVILTIQCGNLFSADKASGVLANYEPGEKSYSIFGITEKVDHFLKTILFVNSTNGNENTDGQEKFCLGGDATTLEFMVADAGNNPVSVNVSLETAVTKNQLPVYVGSNGTTTTTTTSNSSSSPSPSGGGGSNNDTEKKKSQMMMTQRRRNLQVAAVAAVPPSSSTSASSSSSSGSLSSNSGEVLDNGGSSIIALSVSGVIEQTATLSLDGQFSDPNGNPLELFISGCWLTSDVESSGGGDLGPDATSAPVPPSSFPGDPATMLPPPTWLSPIKNSWQSGLPGTMVITLNRPPISSITTSHGITAAYRTWICALHISDTPYSNLTMPLQVTVWNDRPPVVNDTAADEFEITLNQRTKCYTEGNCQIQVPWTLMHDPDSLVLFWTVLYIPTGQKPSVESSKGAGVGVALPEWISWDRSALTLTLSPGRGEIGLDVKLPLTFSKAVNLNIVATDVRGQATHHEVSVKIMLDDFGSFRKVINLILAIGTPLGFLVTLWVKFTYLRNILGMRFYHYSMPPADLANGLPCHPRYKRTQRTIPPHMIKQILITRSKRDKDSFAQKMVRKFLPKGYRLLTEQVAWLGDTTWLKWNANDAALLLRLDNLPKQGVAHIVMMGLSENILWSCKLVFEDHKLQNVWSDISDDDFRNFETDESVPLNSLMQDEEGQEENKGNAGGGGGGKEDALILKNQLKRNEESTTSTSGNEQASYSPPSIAPCSSSLVDGAKNNGPVLLANKATTNILMDKPASRGPLTAAAATTNHQSHTQATSIKGDYAQQRQQQVVDLGDGGNQGGPPTPRRTAAAAQGGAEELGGEEEELQSINNFSTTNNTESGGGTTTATTTTNGEEIPMEKDG